MGTQHYNWAGFWLIAGFMAGIGAAFFLVPLWQRQITSKRKWLLFAAPAVFVCIVIALYALRGTPRALDGATTIAWPDSHSLLQSDVRNASATAGSLDAVANKLAARLAAGQGTDADWQLLQQSYEFIGDNEAAQLAKQHQLKSASAAVTVNAASPTSAANAAVTLDAKLAPYRARVEKNSKDVEAWFAIAELQRAARQFAPANEAYEHLIALKAMTATAWADYADAQASLTGSLSNAKTRNAVEAALKLEPRHAKALWLKASIAHEEHRYADALALWQQLLAAIPNDSADAKIIQANLDEARSLLGTATVATATNSAARIAGRIELDAALKGKVTADMTLFVYAKPDDAMGMPAAVLRMPIKSWPANFVLDDSQAMLPTRKLSQFKTVTVQARLSRSGQALAQSGDLQTDAVKIATQAAQPLVLHLAQVVK